MTTQDKVKSYSKLFDVYNGDVNKVISAIHMSKSTIQKYLKMRNLPEEVLNLLDTNNEKKISIDVAVELSKLPDAIDKIEVLDKITTLTNVQKVDAIKKFKQCDYDIDYLEDIKEDVVVHHNNIQFAPSFPYVIEKSTGKFVCIPENMYDDVVNLIKNKMGELNYYH